MEAYFEYLREMLVKFFEDLGVFFYKWWVTPWENVPGNFELYNSIFQSHVNDFGFLGWFFYVLFSIFSLLKENSTKMNSVVKLKDLTTNYMPRFKKEIRF